MPVWNCSRNMTTAQISGDHGRTGRTDRTGFPFFNVYRAPAHARTLAHALTSEMWASVRSVRESAMMWALPSLGSPRFGISYAEGGSARKPCARNTIVAGPLLYLIQTWGR